MIRLLSLFLAVLLLSAMLAPAARAAVNIERQGAENPVMEVAKSIVWGGLGGLVLGGALAWATEDNENDGDIVRWSFVAGTFLGCGYGIYHVATRPQPTALIEFRGGAPSLHAALPTREPNGEMTVRLVAVRF